MSLVKMPKTFCDNLTVEVMKFWWSNAKGNRGIHWKRKQLLCLSKDKGGLGFKDFHHMNTTWLEKQAWRLMQEPNSYWATNLKSIYFPNSSFWEAKDRRGGSWVWKSIIQGREILKKRGRWSVAQGSEIQIGDDNWLATGERAYLKQRSTARVFKDVIEEHHQWNIRALRENLEASSAKVALQTPIAWTRQQDQLIWPHTSDGAYTIKSGYKTQG